MYSKILLVIAFVLVFLGSFSACKEKEVLYRTLPAQNGMVSATVNGQPWSTALNTARYSIEDSNKFGFGGYMYVDGYRKQFFGISDISLGVPFQKVYSVHTTYAADVPWGMLSDLDVDVVLANYQVADSAADNYVTVDSYDQATRLIKGRFRMTLYIDSNNINPGSYGDTIFIENGNYEVTLSYAP